VVSPSSPSPAPQELARWLQLQADREKADIPLKRLERHLAPEATGLGRIPRAVKQSDVGLRLRLLLTVVRTAEKFLVYSATRQSTERFLATQRPPASGFAESTVEEETVAMWSEVMEKVPTTQCPPAQLPVEQSGVGLRRRLLRAAVRSVEKFVVYFAPGQSVEELSETQRPPAQPQVDSDSAVEDEPDIMWSAIAERGHTELMS
jgi:hypothetical protein